jgi:F-type H+-transporting ATPase subunit a
MHELTAWLNEHLGGFANQVLNALHMPAANPAHPWQEWLITEIIVFVILVIAAALIRGALSMDKPGKSQHIVETIYTFIRSTSDEVGVHNGTKYAPFFATLFIFILFCNLIGLIPWFESPTMFPQVPAGFALATFFYYNYMGFREQGLWPYLKHFAGPMPLLAPLMVPIEIVSHLARPLSLTIRLFANMFAGEQVTLAFLKLTLLVAPAIFMGLHVFVALLQAYVFALLAMIYVSSAVAHEH